jgi:hypothetical protein
MVGEVTIQGLVMHLAHMMIDWLCTGFFVPEVVFAWEVTGKGGGCTIRESTGLQ